MHTKQYRWKARDISRVTDDAVTIVFEAPHSFRYRPGQFINVTIEIDGAPVMRSYSLSSLCEADPYPAITVKRVPGGVMSNYFLNKVSKNHEWLVEGPFGNFMPDTFVNNDDPVVFLAGGSGITPILPVIRHLLHKHTGPVLLFYANRSIYTTMFRDELIELSRRGLSVIWVFSGEQVTADNNTISGRLNKLVLKKLIKKQLPMTWNKAQYFICGPEGLMETCVQTLSDLGIAAQKIYTEHFMVKEAAKEAICLPDKTLEVLLHFNEVTSLLEVQTGKSVLEAAHADKIPVPASCKTGNCGTCYGKIIKGNLHLKRNAALSDSELAEGYTLLCQAFPLTDDVEIELIR